MDKQAFKQRMQNLKSYRENNPGKGYWDWKVQAYQNGGRHALGVGQVFASLADMLFNKERRTPAIAAAAYHTIHQTQNDLAAAPVEAPLIEPIVDAVKSADETPYDPGEVFLLSPENQKKQITKNPNYRVVDTNSEEDPYGIVRRAANYHKEIHGEVPVYDYIADSDTTIKRSNLMPVGTLPMGDYTPELPHAGSYNSVLYYNAGNDKLYQRAYDLNDYGPTDTKDKGASSMYIGPVRWLSRQLDKAGTPFVQRTGFVPFDEEKYYNQLPESARKKVSEWRRLRNSYEYGGEVGNPSVQAIQQKQWLNDWLKSRSKQMAENIDFYSNQNVYGSSMDRMHVSPFFFQDKEKNAAKIIQEQLQYANNIPIYDYREPWVAANKNIPNRKEFLKMNSGVQGAYHKKYRQPHTISVSPIATDRSVILHELSHSTQDKYSIQSSKIDDILKRHQKENHNYDKYYDNPDEVYSRMNQFRYDNNIKPEDIITEEQIEQWKDSSIDNQFINRYSTNTLLDLLNSVARAFENGGEVTRKSLKDIRKESTIGDKLDYNVMLQNQNTYQKEFATNWYKERAKNTKYRSQLGDGKLDKILSDIDKATWKNPTEAMKDNLISQGYTPTEQNIKSQLQAINAKGTKGFAVPSMYSYYGAPRNTWHEGIGHIVGDNNPAILDSTPNVSIPSNDPKYYDYVNQANEKHAQTWDFRGKNQTLKDDTGNYYIDPNRQLTPEDISNMRSKGAKIPEQWESLKDADISELTNTFAYNLSQDPIYYMASGGEVGDPDDKFAKAVNTKLGRTPDGRPLQRGIHIKKKNRGKFNELKRRTGKSTEELTHSKNPLTHKRAIFAQNFSKIAKKRKKKK